MSSQPRRSSLGMGLLRRSKSSEFKRQQRDAQHEPQPAVPKSPPRLPVLYNGLPSPNLSAGYVGAGPGGDAFRPDSLAIMSGKHDTNQPSYASANYTPRPSMEPGRSIISIPPPPIPFEDPYARTESMTHRGRYSYASSAISTINSPRRVRRRKDPTPFNVLVVGTTNSGKTSFLEFLKTALAPPPKRRAKSTPDGVSEMYTPHPSPSGTFIPHYLETEMDGERIGLTLWDSEGLEKNVVDLQLREMSGFLESKFEETFNEEMKVVRSPGVQDSHIHAVFLVLDPARLDRNISSSKAASGMNGRHNGAAKPKSDGMRVLGGLDEDLDLQVLRTLQGKTMVIPVISKADTITTKHMSVLKRTVWNSLKLANLDPLEALGLDDEEDDSQDASRIDEEDEFSDQENRDPNAPPDLNASPRSKRLSGGSVKRYKVGDESLKEDEIPQIPMSIISPDIYEPGVVGRQFPWGFADPMDEAHCDFVRLKESVFGEWRGELREASREQWYEGWRTSRLKQREGSRVRR